MRTNTHKSVKPPGDKILLGLLPFWTPLIPPMGIACLKSFLHQYGYNVKLFDINTNMIFRDIYNNYFLTLKKYIPEEKRGNFYNLGHDLLQNHMMAHLNQKDEQKYIELVTLLVHNNYFCSITHQTIIQLNEIIDEFYTRFERCFLDLLEKEKPGILGLSVFRGTLPASLLAFKLTREKFPHIKTVMGGGIFSQELDINSGNLKYLLEETPYRNYIDKIIVGEGEILFLKYLQQELPQSRKVNTLKDINHRILDLTSAVIPDFSDFEIRHYSHMAAYTSRSCPFQCNFCAETTYWGKYRKKSAKQIVKELQMLVKKYNHRLFLMCDSLLNPIITGLAEELLNVDASLYWDGYLRVDPGNFDKILVWRRGGFYRARIGVESGSPKVLESMGKKITPNQVKQFISNLGEAGIKTTTYWVAGYPGETEEDFRQTLELIDQLKDDIYEAECNPFRYFETGQVNSNEWAQTNRRILLYPENTADLLITQTWILESEPSREVAFQRVNRFVQHCQKLGIPNPYSLRDIHQADERWQKLHKNAVPSLVDFDNAHAHIDENKYVKNFLCLQKKLEDDGDFDF